MLKLFYLCYFITLGVSVPFFPAYLRQLGLSGRQVSVLLAVAPALQLGVPLAWGWLADRTRRPDLILRGLCLFAFLASLPVIFVRAMPALFGIYLAQQLFAVAILSLADSLAVEKSCQGGHYGHIRAFGSSSFVATCLLAGWWLDLRGIRGGDALAPTIVSVGYGLSFLAALGLAGHGSGERPHLHDVRRLLGDRRFLFLPSSFCHSPSCCSPGPEVGCQRHDEELSIHWTALQQPSQGLGRRRGEVREFTSRTRGGSRPAPKSLSGRVHLWTRPELETC